MYRQEEEGKWRYNNYKVLIIMKKERCVCYEQGLEMREIQGQKVREKISSREKKTQKKEQATL